MEGATNSSFEDKYPLRNLLGSKLKTKLQNKNLIPEIALLIFTCFVPYISSDAKHKILLFVMFKKHVLVDHGL